MTDVAPTWECPICEIVLSDDDGHCSVCGYDEHAEEVAALRDMHRNQQRAAAGYLRELRALKMERAEDGRHAHRRNMLLQFMCGWMEKTGAISRPSTLPPPDLAYGHLPNHTIADELREVVIREEK